MNFVPQKFSSWDSSWIMTLQVVCWEYTTAIPLRMPDFFTISLTLSVTSWKVGRLSDWMVKDS